MSCWASTVPDRPMSAASLGRSPRHRCAETAGGAVAARECYSTSSVSRQGEREVGQHVHAALIYQVCYSTGRSSASTATLKSSVLLVGDVVSLDENHTVAVLSTNRVPHSLAYAPYFGAGGL